MDIFDRDATLTIGTIRIPTRDPVSAEPVPSLRVAFKIVRMTAKNPDSAEVTIYNLTQTHRSSLQSRDVPCILSAGYLGNSHQIFSGSLQFSQSVHNGTDWVTTLKAGDGVTQFKSSRVNVSLRGPVTPQQALNAAASALGLPLGNVQQKASGTQERASLKQFLNGLVLSGKSELQLDKVCKAFGLRWFVQDGVVQVLGAADVLGSRRVVLSPGTGLVGSPEAGEDGVVKARSLLLPDLLPGYGVRIESAHVNGDYRIEKTTFIGDTHGQDWYADIECRQLAA